jgi:site-specific DNA-methyltransferase (adenine-specific)
MAAPDALDASGSSRSTGRGELWHADVLQLLGKLADGSVDLVIADPPYAIAKAAWDEFESLDAYLDWCDRWLAEVARVLAPHGSAYVCGFSEILADVKARSARRFASCRWLVWYYRNKANLGRDWGRSHESILHLRNSGARIDVDAIRVPYNGHTTRYPARIQAVSSQYGGASARRDRWEPNPLGAKPRDVIELPAQGGIRRATLLVVEVEQADRSWDAYLLPLVVLDAEPPGGPWDEGEGAVNQVIEQVVGGRH